MNKDTIFGNHYVKLAFLTLGIALLLFISMKIIFMLLQFDSVNSQNQLLVFISLITSGLLVSTYLAQRVG